MPSLRRTLSSPSVRSSPYPTALSNGAAGRAGGHVPRRSSGSETSGRRVLADIDWWRVTDGQRDAEAEQESEEHDRDQDQDQDSEARVTVSESGIDLPLSPLTWVFEGFPTPSAPETLHALATSEFAAFSVAPRTPPRGRHGRESTSSSLESTPEVAETPLEGVRLGIAGMDLGFADSGVPPALPSPTTTNQSLPPFLTTRNYSFDLSSLHVDFAGRFSDIGDSDLFQ